MKGTIYLIDGNENLRALAEQPYASEDLLQTLLEKYPALLSGDASSADESVRWLLVAREIGVPGEEGGNDRWSLDHLFLDPEGIPTLVEVKRASDTRIRREVVGQMLDYAANAVVYWPAESIRARFEAAREHSGEDAAEILSDFLQTEPENVEAIEALWTRVKTNLQAGRIRMVFVADQIPNELKRIIEFMNAQMDPAEVLGVELRQYVGDGLRTLVPRVVGQTAEADRKKAVGSRDVRQWDRDTFLEDLNARRGPREVRVATELLDWIARGPLRIWWGRGKIDGSIVPVLDYGRMKHFTFTAWSNGSIEVPFMILRPPFDTVERREELLARIKEIPGIELSHEDVERRPSFAMEVLAESDAMNQFKNTFEWMLGEIRGAGAAPYGR